MIGNLTVLSQSAYSAWYAGTPGSGASSTTASVSSNGLTASVTIPLGAGNGANFAPVSQTVTSGTTITFTSQDNAVHNIDFVSIPPGATIPGGTPSSNLKQGQSYSVTLTTPGTYTYICDYHSWMKATITVTG
jgi:plastocyanin